MSSVQFQPAIVSHAPELEMGGLFTYHAHHVVAAGEYVNEGEPDCIIRIEYAVDTDGNDVSEKLSKAIAAALPSLLA